MATLDFKLVRPARSSGGDRYETGTPKTDEWMVIYVPQVYSRKNGEPKKEITVTIE